MRGEPPRELQRRHACAIGLTLARVERARRRPPDVAVGRLRVAVFLSAVVATALKLEIAAHTFGTNDVHYWRQFAWGARHFGPVGIYGHQFAAPVYNHGPLAGWMLVAINWLVDNGVASFPFLIRVPACLADLVTALLMFELVRLVRSATQAAIAAVLVVSSPVLFVVSGFHGNTDPVFVMFMLLSVYLIVARGWTLAAGVAFAAAVSIKLVPVVLGPVLLVMLIRLGWRRLAAFVSGGAVVFLLLWLPVIVSRWDGFRRQVLGYNGVFARQWGLVQFLTWAHLPAGTVAWLVGPGRFGILIVSALAAAAVAWRRSDALVPAVGLSLVLFLLLSSAFAMQYLAWPLAGAYLIDTWTATGYNVAASIFIVVVYDHWNRALPWDWHEGRADSFRPREFVLMVVTWVALAAVGLVGLSLLRGRHADQPRASARPSSAS
jgi:4-amino-4-deoxy-L-arabinose transferase-like glycosyltransferase